jgi:hypothetical protein
MSISRERLRVILLLSLEETPKQVSPGWIAFQGSKLIRYLCHQSQSSPFATRNSFSRRQHTIRTAINMSENGSRVTIPETI